MRPICCVIPRAGTLSKSRPSYMSYMSCSSYSLVLLSVDRMRVSVFSPCNRRKR